MVYQTSEKVKIVESNAISEQSKMCRNVGSNNSYSTSFLIAGPMSLKVGKIKGYMLRFMMKAMPWMGTVIRRKTICVFHLELLQLF